MEGISSLSSPACDHLAAIPALHSSASPFHIAPDRACRAMPERSVPIHAYPHRACHAIPSRTRPNHAYPNAACRANLCRARLCRAEPRRACHAAPYLTMPSRYSPSLPCQSPLDRSVPYSATPAAPGWAGHPPASPINAQSHRAFPALLVCINSRPDVSEPLDMLVAVSNSPQLL